MAQLAGRGAKVCEVDVSHLPRLTGEQSGASLKVIARAFKELFLLYGRLRRARRKGETAPVGHRQRIFAASWRLIGTAKRMTVRRTASGKIARSGSIRLFGLGF